MTELYLFLECSQLSFSNLDPEKVSFQNPRGGKKMKKRKELDALLMNGKKSCPKRTKDGHELLQNMDSESNSSELDEFIMQPRKQTVVRRYNSYTNIYFIGHLA